MAKGSWLDRHRGPFRLVVTRPGKKPGHIATEWLKGTVDSDDVVNDATALLADRRDDITHVAVWSVREEQFVHSFREAPMGASRLAS